MSENDKNPAFIPFFAHENALMHYNNTNKRMLIALLAVCITFVITITIFVIGYTIREKNWLDTLSRIQNPQLAEVQNGVYQQSN